MTEEIIDRYGVRGITKERTPIDPETMNYFQEICNDKFFSFNGDLAELRENALSILSDKGVLVDHNILDGSKFGAEVNELELEFFVSIKDNMEYDKNSLISLLSLTRLIINEVGEIRIKNPMCLINVTSKGEAYAALKIISSKIQKCYIEMKKNGDRDLFEKTYLKFMDNELKIDQAHRVAQVKRSKDLKFKATTAQLIERYRMKIILEQKLKKMIEENEKDTIIGGIKKIILGDDGDGLKESLLVCKADIKYIENGYKSVEKERSGMINEEIIPQLRKENKPKIFIPEWYCEHYSEIISQTI